MVVGRAISSGRKRNGMNGTRSRRSLRVGNIKTTSALRPVAFVACHSTDMACERPKPAAGDQSGCNTAE